MALLEKVRGLFQPQENQVLSRTGVASSSARHPSTPAAPEGRLRHSNALREFLKDWGKSEGFRVLDVGSTSSANLTFFTNLGHSVYSDDLLTESAQPAYQLPVETGTVTDPTLFLQRNLMFEAGRFDAILLWDLMDYLPEPLIKPLMQRLTDVLKPGGLVLAYFHTRDGGAEVAHCRYHIHDTQTVQLRSGQSIKLQRIFNNRHVENLFRGYHSVKFFLSRDNLREVLAVK